MSQRPLGTSDKRKDLAAMLGQMLSHRYLITALDERYFPFDNKKTLDIKCLFVCVAMITSEYINFVKYSI